MSPKTDIRGFNSPQPPRFGEAMQNELLAKIGAKTIYTRKRVEDRDHFVRSLRPTSAAGVAEAALLAEPTGRADTRRASFLLAKDQIHERGSYILEAATGHCSNNPKQWKLMRARAFDLLGSLAKASKSADNGRKGKPPLEYSPDEFKTMKAIAESRRYKNWNQRKARIKAEGIKPPGRTWFYNNIVSAQSDS